MYYVYILRSIKDDSRYVGYTSNLRRRFYEHNRGDVNFTKNKKPHKLGWFSVFSSKLKAISFERYLKSGSGHAFAGKRLI